MENLVSILNTLSGIAWGPVMLALIAGTGIFLTLGLKFMPIKKIGYGFRLVKSNSDSQEKGTIAPRSALMTALSATVGTGNIAGVATAIAIGGPGAIFWMWVMGFIGMATKYSEALLAVKFRENDDKGNYYGGPMYYIKNGLGEKWKWLAFIFALFGTVAAFGIGNMIQSNSVAAQLQDTLSVNPLYTGIIIALISSLVIIGGIKRISTAASYLVPWMALIYIISALYIEYILHYEPCRLCIYQRLPYLAAVFISFIGFFYSRNDKVLIIIIIIFTISVIISGYHFGIENSLIKEISSCTNKSLDISNKSKLLETLNKSMPIDCKDTTFKIFGISLAAINTIFSILIVIFSIRTLTYEKN